MTSIIVGIDISKKKFDVCLLAPNTKAQTRIFDNDSKGFAAFFKWLVLKEINLCRVAMEATGCYGDSLAQALHEEGHTVFIINPAQIKYFGMSKLSRTKTDKKDALLIAEFASTHPNLRPWTPLAGFQKKLKNLHRCLDQLKADHAQLLNRLGSNQDEDVSKIFKAQLKLISSQIQKLEKMIRIHIESNPGLQGKADLLLTIPGVGEGLCWAVLAEVPDMKNFQNARQLVAFAGLNPSVYESGTSVKRRGSISKKGSSLLRKILYFPGMSAMRFNPRIKPFADVLRAKGKKGKVIVIACMRKLLHIIYGVLTKMQPFNANPILSTVCAGG